MVTKSRRSTRKQNPSGRRATTRSRRGLKGEGRHNWIHSLTALAAVASAIVAFGGLYYTNRNLDETRRQIEVSQEGQRADRFSKAVELLGSDSTDVRLGGIYALGNLARESPKDHVAIVDVLAAYVRGHTPLARNCDLPKTREQPLPIPDVQVAITVLGSRRAQYDKDGYINLADRCFVGVNLDGGNFSGFNFSGSTVWRSTARNSNFSKANFREATMQHSDFTGADLTCVYQLQWVSFDGSNLSDIIVHRDPDANDPWKHCH